MTSRVQLEERHVAAVKGGETTNAPIHHNSIAITLQSWSILDKECAMQPGIFPDFSADEHQTDHTCIVGSASANAKCGRTAAQ